MSSNDIVTEIFRKALSVESEQDACAHVDVFVRDADVIVRGFAFQSFSANVDAVCTLLGVSQANMASVFSAVPAIRTACECAPNAAPAVAAATAATTAVPMSVLLTSLDKMHCLDYDPIGMHLTRHTRVHSVVSLHTFFITMALWSVCSARINNLLSAIDTAHRQVCSLLVDQGDAFASAPVQALIAALRARKVAMHPECDQTAQRSRVFLLESADIVLKWRSPRGNLSLVELYTLLKFSPMVFSYGVSDVAFFSCNSNARAVLRRFACHSVGLDGSESAAADAAADYDDEHTLEHSISTMFQVPTDGVPASRYTPVCLSKLLPVVCAMTTRLSNDYRRLLLLQ
jgi:hypothetical protein